MAKATLPPKPSRADEDAGAVEHYADATLYDLAYRHRRSDVHFYRLLADERLSFGAPSPIVELACGSGRLTLPLLKAGHTVIGLDRSVTMLAAASRRLRKLPVSRRNSCLLYRADMRSFALKTRVSFIVSAFHSLQHLVGDEELLACLKCVHDSLSPDGWFAFDVLPPHPDWLNVLGGLRWSPRTFRHPTTGLRVRHGTSHSYDPDTKALHMRLHYQPVDEEGRQLGEAQVVRLCHRQFWPGDIERLLSEAGFDVLARYSDFNPAAVETRESLTERTHEHVFVARPKR